MNTPDKTEVNRWTFGPYQVIKHFRGNYQALDSNGRDLIGRYVSKHEANQAVIAHKLQDKAMLHPGVLQKAEAFTTFKGEKLNNWLYQTLIRFDVQELRIVIQKPHKLKELYYAFLDRHKRE